MYSVRGYDQFSYEWYDCLSEDWTKSIEFDTQEEAQAYVDAKTPNGSDKSISDKYYIITPDNKTVFAGYGKNGPFLGK